MFFRQMGSFPLYNFILFFNIHYEEDDEDIANAVYERFVFNPS